MCSGLRAWCNGYVIIWYLNFEFWVRTCVRGRQIYTFVVRQRLSVETCDGSWMAYCYSDCIGNGFCYLYPKQLYKMGYFEIFFYAYICIWNTLKTSQSPQQRTHWNPETKRDARNNRSIYTLFSQRPSVVWHNREMRRNLSIHTFLPTNRRQSNTHRL